MKWNAQTLNCRIQALQKATWKVPCANLNTLLYAHRLTRFDYLTSKNWKYNKMSRDINSPAAPFATSKNPFTWPSLNFSSHWSRGRYLSQRWNILRCKVRLTTKEVPEKNCQDLRVCFEGLITSRRPEMCSSLSSPAEDKGPCPDSIMRSSSKEMWPSQVTDKEWIRWSPGCSIRKRDLVVDIDIAV